MIKQLMRQIEDVSIYVKSLSLSFHPRHKTKSRSKAGLCGCMTWVHCRDSLLKDVSDLVENDVVSLSCRYILTLFILLIFICSRRQENVRAVLSDFNSKPVDPFPATTVP